RPELGREPARLERAHVGEERVEPDVGDVAVVERQLDAPREPGLRARDAEVADRLAQEPEDLAAVAVRHDHVRPFLDEPDEPLLVRAHPEEVVLLGDLRRCHLVVGAEPVHELALLVEPLAPVAVETGVAAEVDVAARVDLREDLPDEVPVRGVGGPDEVVDREPDRVPRRAEGGADPVDVRLRLHTRLRRGLRDLVPVLVRAREREDAPPPRAPEAREHVLDDRRVGVTEVGLGVRVVDGRREVERLARHRRTLGAAQASARRTTRSSRVASTSTPSSARRTTTVCRSTFWRTITPLPLTDSTVTPTAGSARRSSTYVWYS